MDYRVIGGIGVFAVVMLVSGALNVGTDISDSNGPHQKYTYAITSDSPDYEIYLNESRRGWYGVVKEKDSDEIKNFQIEKEGLQINYHVDTIESFEKLDEAKHAFLFNVISSDYELSRNDIKQLKEAGSISPDTGLDSADITLQESTYEGRDTYEVTLSNFMNKKLIFHVLREEPHLTVAISERSREIPGGTTSGLIIKKSETGKYEILNPRTGR